MDYQEVIARIERARDVATNVTDLAAKEQSFARFKSALTELAPKFPEGGKGITLIAGTNGKGSVAKTLETLLSRSGERAIGLYTSPHLMETTERIRAHGRDLTQAEFTAAFVIVEPLVDKYSLSHFEILTLMMCEVFFNGRVRPRVDRAIIEVGVGGRMDPTRLIPHEASVITWLGLDHQELLGENVAAIAAEKFAIVDPGNRVIYAPLPKDANITPQEGWIEAPIYPFHVALGKWVIETPVGEAPLSLMGERAVQNTSIALAVLAAEGKDVTTLLPNLARVRWPCRMERIHPPAGKQLYLSGDHNAQGIASLAEILAHLQFDRLRLVVGIGEKKDQNAMLASLMQLPRAELYLTTTPFKSAPIERYGEQWLAASKFTSEDSALVLEKALADSAKTDLVLVTGSLYLAGHLRKLLSEGRFGKIQLD